MKYPLQYISFLILLFSVLIGNAQVTVQGYTFETGNRGYINKVSVYAIELSNQDTIAVATTDNDGKFSLNLPENSSFLIATYHQRFEEATRSIQTSSNVDSDNLFLNVELQRKPGYIFDITLAEKRETPEQVVDAIKGALIEVYNNTTKKPELVLNDHADPNFQVYLDKNNHYTIMIRKEGYLAKRMEAYVNVAGCILCFEGLGTVQPGVTENLTNNNLMGSLLANVELDKLYEGKTIELQNIYYDYNKWKIRPDAAAELDKVWLFLKDNPNINVELGSHTDARGKEVANLRLSDQRAQSAVAYLMQNGIEKSRLTYKGYGETQLTNRCKNGVDCSDKEHEENRRTELKIVEVSFKDDFKSLADIKREEGIEKLIQELQNQDQIKIEKNSNVPEGLKVVKKEKEKEQAINLEKTADDSKEHDDSMSETKEELESDIIDKGKNISNSDAKNDLDSYTGYKVVMHFSRYPLPENHPIKSDFKNDLAEQKTDQGNHIYMTGSFDEKTKAEAYLKSLQEKYPQAYLVYFKNGVRKAQSN